MSVTASPLLLCHMVFEDPTSRNVTLLGIFTQLRASKFPTPARDLSAYSLLTGEPYATGDLRLKCEAVTTAIVCYDEWTRCQLTGAGKRQVHVRVGELRFPQPGKYRFALSFDGTTIAEQTIEVLEMTNG